MTTKCDTCRGTGVFEVDEGDVIPCPKCRKTKAHLVDIDTLRLVLFVHLALSCSDADKTVDDFIAGHDVRSQIGTRGVYVLRQLCGALGHNELSGGK